MANILNLYRLPHFQQILTILIVYLLCPSWENFGHAILDLLPWYWSAILQSNPRPDYWKMGQFGPFLPFRTTTIGDKCTEHLLFPIVYYILVGLRSVEPTFFIIEVVPFYSTPLLASVCRAQ